MIPNSLICDRDPIDDTHEAKDTLQLNIMGGSNSIFVHKSAHKMLRSGHELLLSHDLSASTDQERGYPGIQKHSQT